MPPTTGPETDSWNAVRDAPAWMIAPERILLHALVRALQPESILEIGTYKGGSTLIMAAALDENNRGAIVCVDPNPAIQKEDWERVSHRATMIVGSSPDAIPEAARAVTGGRFNVVLVDGDHSYEGVRRDIDGVLSFLLPDSYLVFHDSHYWQVSAAIDTALREHSAVLVDCGNLSRESGLTDTYERGHQVVWGGLRVLRFIASAAHPAGRRGYQSPRLDRQTIARSVHRMHEAGATSLRRLQRLRVRILDGERKDLP